MAKQGMKRPDETPEKRTVTSGPAVPELQGKQKNSNTKANPIVEDGAKASEIKVFHNKSKKEKPISKAYPEIDTDLARDNLQNDIPEADLQDL